MAAEQKCHVGERIRKVREAKGLTQTYIAERLQPPVVQTTIGDIEKRADLKVTRAREIALILEVDEKLLTDEQSPLDADDVKAIVRRESLRVFIQHASLTAREQRQFERIVNHTLAPPTVAGWHELRDLIRRFLGHTPGQWPAHESENGRTDAVTNINVGRRKRMARAGVDQFRRSIRRA